MEQDKTLISQRRKARRYLLQALYQWQLTDNSINDIKQHFHDEFDMEGVDQEYFDELLNKICQQSEDIDALILPHLDRQLSELGPVEISVLRIGAYELNQRIDIPYKVCINESVNLTKKFGPQDSYKYINGILDKIAQARTRY